MSGNSFGKIFKITTCGESHGGAVATILEGCPPGLEISEADIQPELDRRKPGQSSITTPRKEADQIKILSGVFEGKTTGTPILLIAINQDMRPLDYSKLSEYYRPGHADYTYDQKYGVRDYRGSGRASARETLARVAAGAVAKKYLKEKLGIEIFSYVDQVYNIKADVDYRNVKMADIESNIVRCPDKKAAEKIIELVEKLKAEGDSVGGTVQGVIRNCPAGLGEPVFDKFSAILGQAMLSINAVKGFEIGSGFDCVNYKGSEHNDSLTNESGKVSFKTNNSGGTLGGITSGQDILFRVAFKPVSTISKSQDTITKDLKATKLEAKGRHDPTVMPRAVPIVDAMAALTVMDFYLRQKAVV